MLPILFSIGPIPISSFGLLLAAGFLAGAFIVWRIAKAYDLNESKILDLSLLVFFGGLIFSRAYFVVLNYIYFSDLSHIFLINIYPGLSLWGGLIGGLAFLKLLTYRAKLNFWQIADMSAVGLMIGLVFGSVGCFLGGCGFGAMSDLPIAVSVVGLVGKRIPINIFEGLIYLVFFFWLWKSAIRFHFNGKIISSAFMLLGIEKLFAEYFQSGNPRELAAPLLLFILGVVIFYAKSKRNFLDDIVYIFKLIVSGKKRNLLLQRLIKYCYNAKINWKVRFGQTRSNLRILPRRIRNRLNVKSTPKNYQ